MHDIIIRGGNNLLEDNIRQMDFDNPHINAITGNSQVLYNRIRLSIAKAKSIDIIVSFLMESGVKMIIRDL